MNSLERYYCEDCDEDARLLSQHGSVEFLTTMRYINQYLKSGMRVLEIGAGTGRYSHALARQGYEVDAIELIQHNIDVFHTNILPGERVTIQQGNAVNLPYNTDCYDITLLLGPLYHLFCEDDQQKALREALRVTKPNGIVFAAYCMSDASILQYGFLKGHIHELLAAGLLDLHCFQAKPNEIFSLVRKEDVDRLMEGLPARRLHFVATDCYTNHMKERVDAMDDATFALYLQYHYFLCERPEMIGISHHILDIFTKEAQNEPG